MTHPTDTPDMSGLEELARQFGFEPGINIEGKQTYYQKLDTHEWVSNETLAEFATHLAEAERKAVQAFGDKLIKTIDPFAHSDSKNSNDAINFCITAIQEAIKSQSEEGE